MDKSTRTPHLVFIAKYQVALPFAHNYVHVHCTCTRLCIGSISPRIETGCRHSTFMYSVHLVQFRLLSTQTRVNVKAPSILHVDEA